MAPIWGPGVGRRIFTCITVSDFEEWRRGELPVPTFAILVEPRGAKTPKPVIPFALPHSRDALEVQDWIRQSGNINKDEFVVAELPGNSSPELKRVYVGYRHSQHLVYIALGEEIES